MKTILGKIREKIANKWIASILFNFVIFIDYYLICIHKEKNIVKLIRQGMYNRTIFPNELALLYSVASLQKNKEGDFAETGVYKGSSARIICEAKGNKPFHLFDTFKGMPEVLKIDKKYKKGMLNDVSFERVKQRLSKYNNILFYKGFFPDTAEAVKDKKFSFVNIDMDIYKSTKDSLEFFYKRMVKGGIIIGHDYQSIEAVKKAFDKFFDDKTEKVIPLCMSQCIVIKQ